MMSRNICAAVAGPLCTNGPWLNVVVAATTKVNATNASATSGTPPRNAMPASTGNNAKTQSRLGCKNTAVAIAVNAIKMPRFAQREGRRAASTRRAPAQDERHDDGNRDRRRGRPRDGVREEGLLRPETRSAAWPA